MTAEWETKLTQIEKGQYVPEQFMEEIESMMKNLVSQYADTPNAPAKATPGVSVIGTCPHCGSDVAEREKGFFCTSRECRFVVWKDNAFFARLGKRPMMTTEADGRAKFSLEFENGGAR